MIQGHVDLRWTTFRRWFGNQAMVAIVALVEDKHQPEDIQLQLVGGFNPFEKS